MLLCDVEQVKYCAATCDVTGACDVWVLELLDEKRCLLKQTNSKGAAASYETRVGFVSGARGCICQGMLHLPAAASAAMKASGAYLDLDPIGQ